MFKFYEFNSLTDGDIYLKVDKRYPGNKKIDYVPSYLCGIYLCKDNTKVGAIDIRIGYNEGIYYGGNIGYFIIEEYRGNNYAYKACLLIQEIAKKHKMKKLYITCNPDNYPSRRVCEKLGLRLVEITKLPEDNPMYLEGEKEKCIFEWIL